MTMRPPSPNFPKGPLTVEELADERDRKQARKQRPDLPSKGPAPAALPTAKGRDVGR